MSSNILRTLLNDPTPDLEKINVSVSRFMKRPKLQKKLFKVLTKIWSEDEDTRRILALVNVLKALTISPKCCGLCIKLMYAAYVRNCKFVVGSTVAHINFMRISLMEVFSRNLDEAYLHSFAYTRQLAISLRKAYTTHSKTDVQTVLNWPFVNSLRLWVEFVDKFSPQHKLVATLVHPLVQLLVGLTKLNASERWIPLRFHCVSMLHTLAGVPTLSNKAEDTGNSKEIHVLTGRSLTTAGRILVPSLPLLLDIFQLVNFNRRAFGVSKAPLDLRLLLHFSPSQRKETASLDAIVSWLCDLLAEAAAIHANSLAFPEYTLPLINELKQFCNTCRVASFTRQIKTLLVKVREHSDFISMRRRQLRNLANPEELAQVESSLSLTSSGSSASPFLNFYILHKEVRSKELARLTENNQKDVISSDKPEKPTVKQRRSDHKGPESESDTNTDDSNESYDLDDGSTVTHVSKSKVPKASIEESSDSDFDLEAALNESETEEKVARSSLPCDQLSDFALSDSEAEIISNEELDEELPSGVSKLSRKRKKLKKKPKPLKKRVTEEKLKRKD